MVTPIAVGVGVGVRLAVGTGIDVGVGTGVGVIVAVAVGVGMSVGVGVGTISKDGALTGVRRTSGSDVWSASPWQADPAMSAMPIPTKNAALDNVFRKVGIISIILEK